MCLLSKGFSRAIEEWKLHFRFIAMYIAEHSYVEVGQVQYMYVHRLVENFSIAKISLGSYVLINHVQPNAANLSHTVSWLTSCCAFIEGKSTKQ